MPSIPSFYAGISLEDAIEILLANFYSAGMRFQRNHSHDIGNMRDDSFKFGVLNLLLLCLLYRVRCFMCTVNHIHLDGVLPGNIMAGIDCKSIWLGRNCFGILDDSWMG